MDDPLFLSSLTVAASAGIVLAVYRHCNKRYSVEYHLYRDHRTVYHCHRAAYVILWAALLFNLRFCAKTLLASAAPPGRSSTR